MTKELREKRANLANQARELLDKASAEKRDLTAEESTQFDKIHTDIDELKRQIDRTEQQQELEAELSRSQGTVAGPAATAEPESGTDTAEARSKACRNWIMHGIAGLSPEEREIMAAQRHDLPAEARAMAAGIDTAGGYTVADDFVARIETAMKAFAGVRNTRATIVRTAGGNEMPMPTSDDTNNKGERVGENKAVGTQDITMGSKSLRAYMYSSKLLRVSIQFLQDTSISNIEGWLAERLGERIGRKTAEEFITGTGNNMPEGLESSTTEGKQGSTQTSIKYNEFVDMEHSIDPAYRRVSEWLLGDGLVKAAKKLKDGEGRPLWVPGIAVKEPDTILSYPFTVDQEIPNPAASRITGYFGDFSKFHIRDVNSMQMLRLTERYAEYLQVAFLLFSRHDSILLDAGTNPIKHFKQSA